MLSTLFDTVMIYYGLSTEWCSFFILTFVLPLCTSAKLYHTCPMYKTKYLLKNKKRINKMCYHLHCMHFYFVLLSHYEAGNEYNLCC